MNNGLRSQRVSISNILLLLLAGSFLVSAGITYTKTWRAPNDVLGPGGLPFVAASLWFLVLAALTVFQAIKPHTIDNDKITIGDVRTIRALIAISLTVLYVALVGTIGFIITNIVYVAALAILCGGTKRTHIVIAITISIVATFSIYLFYTRAFNLPVPGEF